MLGSPLTLHPYYDGFMAGLGCLCGSLGGLTTSIHQCYNAPMQTIQKAWRRSGQFAPCQSGNPGGRLKDEHRVAELARSFTVEAINTLVDLMRHE